MLRFIGILLIIFGILDLVLFYFADIDLTGVSWSPYVSSLVGGILMKIGGGDDKDE
jgi:hypothetical protein